MRPKFNKFVTNELEPHEERVGSILHDLQLAVIQNDRAQVAIKLVETAGTVDPDNPLKSALERAELLGQMESLDWIISRHEAAVIALQAEQANQSQSTTEG